MRTDDRPTRSTRRRGRGIRQRLIGVLLIPTLAVLALGGLRMQDTVERSRDLDRTESLTRTLPAAFRLALLLEAERDAGATPGTTAAQLADVRATTDRAVAAWQAEAVDIDTSADLPLRRELGEIVQALADLPRLRADESRQGPAANGYTDALEALLGLTKRLSGLSDVDLAAHAAALGQARPATEAIAALRAGVAQALTTGAVDDGQIVALARALEKWTGSADAFAAGTDPRTRAAFERLQAERGAPIVAVVRQLLSGRDPSALRPGANAWERSSGEFVAELADTVTGAAEQLADDVRAQREDARNDAALSAAFMLVVLALALTGMLLLSRSIIRPLRQLRADGLDMARRELPERVRAIVAANDVTTGHGEHRQPGSSRTDEIGEVARAFEAVQAEAVRLAAGQAQIRATVETMVVNLARRNQALLERQLRVIDELEAREADPDQLRSLFSLDHLATRMRRTGESLMVVAGGGVRAQRGSVPVVEVLRAAAAAVEHYPRVQIASGDDRPVRAAVAGDLIHLLAELVENATSFSPPDTPVVVRTSQPDRLGDLQIEILDEGIGMTSEELAVANAKLQHVDDLDPDVVRMMGLVVTARLAARSGFRVELHARRPRGVVALVSVPAGALDADATRDPRHVAEPAVEPAAPAPAAEVQAAPPAGLEPAEPVPPVVAAAPPLEPPGPAAEPGWLVSGQEDQEPEELLTTFLSRGRPASHTPTPPEPHEPTERAGAPAESATNVVPFPAGPAPAPAAPGDASDPIEPDPFERFQDDASPGPGTPPSVLPFPAPRAPLTDPLGAVEPPSDEGTRTVSPIFADLESEWFLPRGETKAGEDEAGEDEAGETTGWSSPGAED